MEENPVKTLSTSSSTPHLSSPTIKTATTTATPTIHRRRSSTLVATCPSPTLDHSFVFSPSGTKRLDYKTMQGSKGGMKNSGKGGGGGMCARERVKRILKSSMPPTPLFPPHFPLASPPALEKKKLKEENKKHELRKEAEREKQKINQMLGYDPELRFNKVCACVCVCVEEEEEGLTCTHLTCVQIVVSKRTGPAGVAEGD